MSQQPLSRSDIERIVTDKVNQIISDAQFGLSKVQSHTHNGTDTVRVTYTDLIGGPIFGTAAPTTIPATIGQVYINTTNSKVYIATGTANSGNWVLVN